GVGVFVGGMPARREAGDARGEAVRSLLRHARRGDSLALLAYVDPESRPLRAALERLRARLVLANGLATSIGYGPRYLHSTGQLHKGGPGEGLFIFVVPDDRVALPIPGKPYDFETLKQAQALGDYQSLKRRGRRVVRLRYSVGARAALRALEASLRSQGRKGVLRVRR